MDFLSTLCNNNVDAYNVIAVVETLHSFEIVKKLTQLSDLSGSEQNANNTNISFLQVQNYLLRTALSNFEMGRWRRANMKHS